MAGKLSIAAQQEMAFFDEARKKVDRMHSLVEQLAATRIPAQQTAFIQPIQRVATEAQVLFMNAGYGVMADSCNQLVMKCKGGGAMNTKIRNFRELTTSVKSAMDVRIKIIIAEELTHFGGG